MTLTSLLEPRPAGDMPGGVSCEGRKRSSAVSWWSALARHLVPHSLDDCTDILVAGLYLAIEASTSEELQLLLVCADQRQFEVNRVHEPELSGGSLEADAEALQGRDKND